ncbi:hypothetical protein ACFL17_07885 [Pseudomonadota bacterium]
MNKIGVVEKRPQEIENGTVRDFDGKRCVYYDGYWLRYYEPPKDSLREKQVLIEGLTRRTFHHTEPGINTPGDKLDEARKAYESAENPERKRVNGAMLAGALINRAADIFHAVVSLNRRGVSVSPDNELMRQCEQCFQEALTLGKTIKHFSGEEGIDELWGEPLKAFSIPVEDFYSSRYLKIAQTHKDMDRITEAIQKSISWHDSFAEIRELFSEFVTAAKLESETLRTDSVIFEVWPRFVVANEKLSHYEQTVPENVTEKTKDLLDQGYRLVQEAQQLLGYLAGARVPMPKSTQALIDSCNKYQQLLD